MEKRYLELHQFLSIILGIMTTPTKWTGQDELIAALNGFVTGRKRPISQSKIRAATDICLKYQSEYKMVVYEVEKFIRKSNADDKLPGVFVLDCVCKRARELFGKSGDVFTPRFAIRIKETLSSLAGIPSEDQGSLRGIFESWTRTELFPRDAYFAMLSTLPLRSTNEQQELLDPYGSKGAAGSSEGSRPPSIPDSGSETTGRKELEKEKLKSKEESKSRNLHNLLERGKLPISRICPFKINESSSCPFGSNCRFSHSDWSFIQSQFAFKSSSTKLQVDIKHDGDYYQIEELYSPDVHNFDTVSNNQKRQAVFFFSEKLNPDDNPEAKRSKVL